MTAVFGTACIGAIGDPLAQGHSEGEALACDTMLPPADAARRLNSDELDTIVADVLGDASRPFRAIGNDYGERVGELLGTSERFVADYLEVAMAVAAGYIQREAPRCSRDDEGCLNDFLAPVVERLLRRPLASERVERLVAFARTSTSADLGIDEALAAALATVLVSPDFLLVGTDISAEPGVHELDGYAIAERMALTVWQSVPDDELRRAAAAGDLARPEEVTAQARRMLDDPSRGGRFLDALVDRLFDFPSPSSIPPGLADHPEAAALAGDMRAEALRYLRTMFEHDLDISRLVASDFTFVNERLARHYGIDGVTGTELRRVTTAGTSRVGGLLTMGAVLAREGDLIHRGVNILHGFLCEPLVAPSADVIAAASSALSPDATVREQVTFRTGNPACLGCHQLIDPLGAVYERFDGAGRERDADERGEPVAYQMPFLGTELSSPADVAKVIASDVGLCVGSHVLGWMTSRRLAVQNDRARCATEDMLARSSSSGLRSLVLGALTTDAFRNRVLE